MGAFLHFLVFIVSVNFVFGRILLNDEEKKLEWPTEYHFEGEKIDFGTTLKIPFEIWYSAEQHRSRRDFYGGVTKEIYSANMGHIYTEFSKTKNDMSIIHECWKTNLTGEQMNFLPDTSEFSYTGETTMLLDKLVEIWINYNEQDGKPNIDETLYVYRTTNGIDVPVQHVSKIYSPTTGELKQNIITNYYNFKDTVTKKDTGRTAKRCVVHGSELTKNFERAMEILHPDFSGHLDIAFESYANHHNKNYEGHQMQLRKRIFEMNWRNVRKHNSENLKYKLEINAFSDWTPNELKYLTGVLGTKETPKEASPFPHTLEEVKEIAEQLPENFDLRLEGAVTAPKSQGECGSCWAFAAAATVEGALARVTGGKLVDLSEQSLVDCAWSKGPQGCDGALIPDVWNYVLVNGIPTERDYGIYLEKDGICHLSNASSAYKISGFAQVTPRNSDAMKVALYKYGPANVGVEVTDHMYSYSSGVFYDMSCDPKNPQPNHAVTVVGYGNRDGEDYWIIKNSWGESWGEDGYILISAKNNNCFVLDQPFYAIV